MKCAQIDPNNNAVQQVVGFYLVKDASDPEGFDYRSIPTSDNLVSMSDAQWADRFAHGWYDPTSATFVARPAYEPTPAQQAYALLSGNLTVTSAGTPALNAPYHIDAITQSHIQAEMLYVTVNGTFADGTSTLVWLDASGVSRTFPSVAEFRAFSMAVAAFIAACYKVINGTSASLPNASVTIA